MTCAIEATWDAREERRSRILSLLAFHPDNHNALLAEAQGNYVVVTLGFREVKSGELVTGESVVRKDRWSTQTFLLYARLMSRPN